MTERVIALGFFDGVHIGHGALLRKTAELGREKGLAPAALTFCGSVTGKPTMLLNSVEDRVGLIREQYGIGDVILLPFGEPLRRMAAEDFPAFLQAEYGARALVVGYDFTYGYRGAGNAGTLASRAGELGMECYVVPRVTVEGQTVSSSVIRELVREGRMEEAEKLLGHPHRLTAVIREGKHLGRTIGTPTMNQLLPENVAEPRRGVYISKALLPDGRSFYGVTNIGVRPTVSDGENVTVETWLQSFSGELVGQNVRLELLHFLREERRFADLEALKEQIHKDAEAVRRYTEA